MNKSMQYRQISGHGPGGRDCSCCFPKGGSKGRKMAKKQDEKKVRNFFTDLVKKEIQETI